MGVRVDFTGVSSGFEKIEPGVYLARVKKIEQRMSQAQKPYLNWVFVIIGGDYDGRNVFYMTSLAPNALWKLKDVLAKAFGYSRRDLAGEFDLDTEALIGEEIAVVIGEEEYNGEMRDRVIDVVSASAVGEGPTFL
ncbi:MAG: hypothetical protein DDT19_01450 [Syntrophomonadaceae bacterium]|nr:hypothetical protein [Bacillota bacterium]